MRPVILVLLLLHGTASADDGWCGTKFAELDLGAGLFAQATRYANQPNSNVGAAVELTIDLDRWQYFAELAMASVRLGENADQFAGTMYRAGIGVRHIARRFSMPRLDFELGFEALAVIQDIDWKTGEGEARPEFDVGFSWNFVFFRKVGFRTSVRAFFTPAPASEAACRGPCMTTEEITSGYMIVTGLVW